MSKEPAKLTPSRIAGIAFLLLVLLSGFIYLRSGIRPPEMPQGGKPSAAEANVIVQETSKAIPQKKQSGVALAKPLAAVVTAATLYSDETKSLSDRFRLLYGMATAGDHDAMHLAYQIQLDCKLWPKLSADGYPKGVWTAQMDVVHKALIAKCSDIASQPAYASFDKVGSTQPRDFFEEDVRNQVRSAFADSGIEGAVSAALSVFKNRPDPVTAQAIANTLAEMDVTKFDDSYQLTGLDSSNPNYRRSIYETALTFLSCDYGVPCGPDSEIVASLCMNGGICHPGYSLREIYEQFLLSGEDFQNMQSILAALRKSSGS